MSLHMLERFLGEENESNASDGTRVQDCSEDAATEVFISSQCLNNFQEKKTNSMRQMGLVRCISTEERIHKISAFIHLCIHFT